MAAKYFKCRKCNKERESSFFSKHRDCKSGYDLSTCKPCKKAERDYASVPIESAYITELKKGLRVKNLPFTLSFEDIVLPKVCPVFGKPFIYGDTDWTYSIDRIDPYEGYTPENIAIISNKANRTKNDATLEELEAIIKWLNS